MTNKVDVIGEAVRLVSEGVSVTLPVNGQSMLPFIIGGQESVILQGPEGAKIGDVVLAWADGNRWVVHRIIAIDGDRVTLMGDGNLRGTESCTVSDMKALVTHVVGANGKIRKLDVWWRRQAVRMWIWLRPIRRYLILVNRIFNKMI